MKVEIDAKLLQQILLRMRDKLSNEEEGELYNSIKYIVDEARKDAKATARQVAIDALDKIDKTLHRAWFDSELDIKMSSLHDIASTANEALEAIKELQSFVESD